MNTQIQIPLTMCPGLYIIYSKKWKDVFHCLVVVKDNHLGQPDSTASLHPTSSHTALSAFLFTFCCDWWSVTGEFSFCSLGKREPISEKMTWTIHNALRNHRINKQTNKEISVLVWFVLVWAAISYDRSYSAFIEICFFFC